MVGAEAAEGALQLLVGRHGPHGSFKDCDDLALPHSLPLRACSWIPTCATEHPVFNALAVPVDGNAQLLVSGDSHLRDMHPFRGIAIATPGEFIAQGARGA